MFVHFNTVHAGKRRHQGQCPRFNGSPVRRKDAINAGAIQQRVALVAPLYGLAFAQVMLHARRRAVLLQTPDGGGAQNGNDITILAVTFVGASPS